MFNLTFLPSVLSTFPGGVSSHPANGAKLCSTINTMNTVYNTLPASPRLEFRPRLIAPPTSCPPTRKESQKPRNLPWLCGSG